MNFSFQLLSLLNYVGFWSNFVSFSIFQSTTGFKNGTELCIWLFFMYVLNINFWFVVLLSYVGFLSNWGDQYNCIFCWNKALSCTSVCTPDYSIRSVALWVHPGFWGNWDYLFINYSTRFGDWAWFCLCMYIHLAYCSLIFSWSLALIMTLDFHRTRWDNLFDHS